MTPNCIRVFPRRTKATPMDALAFVGGPPLWLTEDEVGSRVLVSCTFTWDRPEAERLARDWRFRFPAAEVLVGGPAYGDAGGEFEPGVFLRRGYVITSRGCPNRCPRCMVPSREGGIRTLTVKDGWDVLDNNLLACPHDHIAAVLAMLKRQPMRARFTGGLEAARFTRDVAAEILAILPDVMFFAYDQPANRPVVERAFATIYELTGWSEGTFRHNVGCYVLCGWEGDTVAEAEERIRWVIDQGARAYPMYWRGEDYSGRPAEWHDLVGSTVSFGGGR